MSEDERRNHLTPGKEYKVVMEDCCIEGELKGTFLRRILYDDEDGVDMYEFDFGTIGPDWGKWTATELTNPEN